MIQFSKVFSIFSLGFGAIIGVGWSVTLNNLIIMGGGVLPTIIGFAVSTLFMIPIALCFAELTPAMPVAGGVIAYSYRAYNSRVSFLGGWTIVLAYLSILPWEGIVINDILAFIFPFFREGPVLYRIAGENVYLRALILGTVLSLVIILFNWRGLEFAAGMQSALTIVLMICSLICVIAALCKADISNFKPIYAPMEGKQHFNFLTGILALSAMAPFYYCGFDTIPQGAEDIGASIEQKKLGRVIVLAVLSAGVFYVSIVISAGSAYPWLETINLDRPVLANLLRIMYGGLIGDVLFVITIIGTLAGLITTWNGFYIAGSRLILGMGRASFLPEAFAAVHSKHRTPVGGGLLCAAIMLIGPFFGIGIIDKLMLLGSTAFVIGWLLVCLSAWKLRVSEPNIPRPYKMPGGKATAILGCLVSAFMLFNCLVPIMPGYIGSDGLNVLVIWYSLGAVLYIANRKNRQILSPQEHMDRIFDEMN